MNVRIAEQREKDDRPVVLPFYLLCDVSGSMAGEIGTLNKALSQFRNALAKNPVLSDKVRFGVVDFSDDAHEVIPLSDFSTADLENRQLEIRRGTSFAASFTKIRQVIDKDMTAGEQQYRFFRPAVFFLTDGYPNSGDPWTDAFASLTGYDAETQQGFARYPLFVPFGIGDADAGLLATLAHPQGRSKLYMAREGADPANAINGMTDAMLKSVLASGRSALAGKPQHVLPSKNDIGNDVEVYEGGDFVT